MHWGCYSVDTDEVSPAAVSTTSAPAQSAVSHNRPVVEPLVSLRGGANPASCSKAEMRVSRNTAFTLYEPSAVDMQQKKLEVRPRVYLIVPQ